MVLGSGSSVPEAWLWRCVSQDQLAHWPSRRPHFHHGGPTFIRGISALGSGKVQFFHHSDKIRAKWPQDSKCQMDNVLIIGKGQRRVQKKDQWCYIVCIPEINDGSEFHIIKFNFKVKVAPAVPFPGKHRRVTDSHWLPRSCCCHPHSSQSAPEFWWWCSCKCLWVGRQTWWSLVPRIWCWWSQLTSTQKHQTDYWDVLAGAVHHWHCHPRDKQEHWHPPNIASVQRLAWVHVFRALVIVMNGGWQLHSTCSRVLHLGWMASSWGTNG